MLKLELKDGSKLSEVMKDVNDFASTHNVVSFKTTTYNESYRGKQMYLVQITYDDDTQDIVRNKPVGTGVIGRK